MAEIINIDPTESQDVIVEVKNWTTGPPQELGKFAFLHGEPPPPPDGPPEPITTPLFFTIPPQRRLEMMAFFPPDPLFPHPSYEVRVTAPPTPIVPPDPVLVNSFGVNAAGVPRQGNTVLNHGFTS
nr:hypothetical protein [Ectobacillus panaciterrae]